MAGGETLTYAELDEAARSAARRLAAGAGERLELALPPGRRFAELLHASAKLGTVLVPRHPRGGRREPPLRPESADVPLRETVEPEAVHSLLHTSGTAGGPRPVELTYANHHASAAAQAAALGAEPDDRWLCVLAVHHVAGLAIFLRAAIGRVTVVAHESFDPDRVREELRAGGITLVSLVPTMLRRLLDAGPLEAPRLRALLLGGGPIPPDLIDCGLPVVPTYGMTEAASTLALGSPGRPLPGAELRTGDDGELLARGPMIAPGALGADGWLHTGDAGHLDQDGRLHVTGRLKELIVTGGENVAPAEVEAALTAHPAVADAGVVGLPDHDWGEAVTAFVVLRGEADDLDPWCRERLEPYKVPKRFVRVESLPRNLAGKLRRDALRARAS